MPITPINYSKTQIYKLIHNDDINNENIYIGSTTNFVKRKCCHKRNSTNEKSKDYKYKVYQNIRLNGGWTKWSMILVEKFPCIEKNEADVRERYWIDHFKSQLNSWIPSRTKEEWKNDNKEIITGKKKERYEKNKKELVEYHKEDYEKNKKELLEKMKEKIQCECGCFSTKTHLLRHQKSKKHLDLMSTKII